MKITPLDAWIHRKIAANRPALTRQELEAWQLARLNETLALVRARSPFYRQLFAAMPERIDSFDEFRSFPFTTPEDIRRDPFRLACVSQDEIQRVVTLQSSGTTGEPKRIFFTAADQELTIDFFGVGMSTLTRPGDRVLILLPVERPGSVGDLLRTGLERLGRQPIPYGPVLDPQHALAAMQSRRANCVVGSPTQVLGLARRWSPAHTAPRVVLLSTDYVPSAIVDVLEKTWGCEVFNHYGATEMGLGGGVECAAHRGYHLREADLYFEVIDPHTGQTVPPGEYGEVVFTTLTRRGMPLVRYRTGDRSRFIPAACPCGTRLKMLEKVSGRLSGTVTVGDETLKLSDFDEALFPIPGLLNFSVTVTGSPQKPCSVIETHMLPGAGSTRLVEQALASIPSIKNLDWRVSCREDPKEAGSLYKRAIVDKRV